MLTINSYIDKSNISGKGLFTGDIILKGQVIWKYSSDKDLIVLQDIIPEDLRDYFDKYSTVIVYDDSYYYELDGDNTRYMNHSENPNIMFIENIGLATRDIGLHEELTCDYRTITVPTHFQYLMSI